VKRLLKSPAFLLLLRIALGGIFLYAGSVKLLEPREFADRIAAYQMLPLSLISPMALGLPPLEMILGLFLVIGWKSRMAALGITLLLGIFLLALGQGILRGLPIDCGCFGSGSLSPWKLWFSLGRDAMFFALSCWLWIRLSKQP
jgi:putative oxidoreductase